MRIIDFGENILTLRKSIGLTATELAKRVGVGQSYISEIEKSRKTPTIDVLQRIAKELNVTVSDLLGETALNLPEEQLQLLEQTKDLNSEQIRALITVVKAFNKWNPEKAEIPIESKTDALIPDIKNRYEAKAAHYEGEEGLNEDDQSAIQSEIDKIKEQFNPNGTPKNKK